MGKNLKPKVKVWLEKEEKLVFGKGREELFKAIDEQGSISKAARSMEMSYKAAWEKIKVTEKRLGQKLVEKQVGGRSGGGTALTPKGRELLAKYEKLRRQCERETDKIFKRLR